MAFMIGRPRSQFRDGKIVTIRADTKTLSTTAIYSYKSESVAMYPNGSLYDTSEIVSSVKYCAFLPKSRGLFSESDDRYFLRIRSTKACMLRSTVPSRFSFSFPLY